MLIYTTLRGEPSIAGALSEAIALAEALAELLPADYPVPEVKVSVKFEHEANGDLASLSAHVIRETTS